MHFIVVHSARLSKTDGVGRFDEAHQLSTCYAGILFVRFEYFVVPVCSRFQLAVPSSRTRVGDVRAFRLHTPENELNPPSTGMIVPVTKVAASLTSHNKVPSRSSGTP